jgi:hypothetical protein
VKTSPPTPFRLRVPATEIPKWARAFTDPSERRVDALGRRVRARGYLRRPEFLELCRWKSPRPQRLYASNTAARIREATGVALASPDERAKIYVLRTLAGVGWPTASVILHFCDRRPYPILDYRALWSVGVTRPPVYSFEFWWAYTRFTRALARATRHDMRTLDRALWQYAKEHQR